MFSIGDLAVDFDAAIDRAGVHDEAGGFQFFRAGLGKAEEGDIFAQAGEVFLALALVLDAEEVDDISLGEDFVDAVADADTELFKAFRDEGRRADQRDFRAEFEEAEDVRAGNAAEENIADDGDIEAFDFSEFLADGEDVEKALGRMLVRAVAGVDDAGVEPLGEELRGTRGAVSEDDDVGAEGLEIEGGVLERFAFLQAGGRGGDVHHIGAETHGGDLE